MQTTDIKHLTTLLQNFCAYQERCIKEVMLKAKTIFPEVNTEELEIIINALIDDNFINEKRFAENYTSGKLKYNQWGKQKIILQLKSKFISEENIQNAINQIKNTEYQSIMLRLVNSKIKKKDAITFEEKHKLYNFLYQKGFDTEDIKQILKQNNL